MSVDLEIIEGDPFLEMQQSKRAQLVQRSEAIKKVAVDMKRPLSDDEKTALRAYSEEVKAIDEQLDVASYNFALDSNVAERIESLSPSGTLARSGYQWPTAGHALWDILHQNDREARSRYVAVQTRAAEHMGIGPVAGITPVAGSFENIHVDPNVGPVLDYNPKGMPFLSAVGITQAPNSLSFMRPRLVDPHFEDGVGEQALQKAELPSKHFTFESDTLTLTTTGGYLNVSQQLLTLDPTSLNTIISQLNRRLSWGLERTAIAEVAETTINVPLADPTDPAQVQAALAEAAALVFTATQELPEWIDAGPDGWSNLAALTDAAGRPLYPPVAPTNPQGTGGGVTSFGISPMGLNLIVTPAITGPEMYVGNSAGFEAYVVRYPVLEAVEPSVLGRQVAVAASSVYYRPPTTEAGPGGTPPAVQGGIVQVG